MHMRVVGALAGPHVPKVPLTTIAVGLETAPEDAGSVVVTPVGTEPPPPWVVLVRIVVAVAWVVAGGGLLPPPV
jgi:hypothetical protein